MPISNEHLNDTVKTWDGLSYNMMSLKEAKAAEKKGLVQIATNLQASQLKHATDFDVVRDKQVKSEPVMPPGVEPAPKVKKTYKTRQMKAEK